MQIVTTSGGTINFIAREDIIGTKTYTIKITSENKNKVILTDTTPTIGSDRFYSTYVTTHNFTENAFFNLELTNTTDNTIIYRDMIFCTDQPSSTFEITTGVYTQHDTGANEYKYYTAP